MSRIRVTLSVGVGEGWKGGVRTEEKNKLLGSVAQQGEQS